jgi:hypothetical protein
MMALVIITFAVALVYVAVLAITLILTTFHLGRAARTAARLAAGLEAVDGHTRKLSDYLATINSTLGQLRNGLTAVDASYGRVLQAAGLKEPPSREEAITEMVASEHAGEVSQHASGAGGYHPGPERE